MPDDPVNPYHSPEASIAPRRPGWCSFCHKEYRYVGPLAEGPDQVYICFRCAQACVALIEAEYRRIGIDLPQK
jgi:hypothetical protein